MSTYGHPSRSPVDSWNDTVKISMVHAHMSGWRAQIKKCSMPTQWLEQACEENALWAVPCFWWDGSRSLVQRHSCWWWHEFLRNDVSHVPPWPWWWQMEAWMRWHVSCFKIRYPNKFFQLKIWMSVHWKVWQMSTLVLLDWQSTISAWNHWEKPVNAV